MSLMRFLQIWVSVEAVIRCSLFSEAELSLEGEVITIFQREKLK